MHVHDVVEIVCLTAGGLTMTIGGKQFSVTPGDIAVVFPSVPHSYDDVSEDADGVAMLFSPNAIGEYTHNFRCKMPVSPFLGAREKNPDIGLLVDYMKKLSLQTQKHLKMGYLHLFLAYLFSCLPLCPVESLMDNNLSSRVLQYISEHYTDPISLESVSKAMGISRTHLSHLFSQQLKINFCHYIHILRIDLACKLLQDPSNNISQIIYLCGYGNSRTFHRAFLSCCQMTPKQYRSRFSDDREQEEA